MDLRKPAGDGGSTQSSQPDPAFTLLGHGWIGLYFSEFVHPLRVSSLREPRLAKLAEVVLHSERVDYPFVRHRLFLPRLLGSPIVFGITLGDHRPRLHVVTGTVLSKQVCMSFTSCGRQVDARGSGMVSEGRVLDCVCALSCLLWNFSTLCWMVVPFSPLLF